MLPSPVPSRSIDKILSRSQFVTENKRFVTAFAFFASGTQAVTVSPICW
jgi:hypothetical protein